MRKFLLLFLVCTSFTIFAQDVVNDVKEKVIDTVEKKVEKAVESKVEAATKATKEVVETATATKEVVDTKTQDKTTFYLITNGEKKEPSEKYPDPYLSDSGKLTAKKWVNVFANVKFDAIYAEELTSAKQTAQYIATSKELGIYQFETATMYDDEFKYITNGKNVLIVTDSANLSKFANTVLGKETVAAPKEGNYSNLFIISNTKDVKDAVVLDLN